MQESYSAIMGKAGRKHGKKTGIHVNGMLNVAIFKEGRSYLAYAPALDLVAQGKSVNDVRKNFAEVFDIYLEETIGRGTLEKDLLRCGWNRQAGAFWPPAMSRFPSPEKIGKDLELTALAIVPMNGKRVCRA